MVFSSVGFLGLFLPAVLFLYFLSPKRWRNIVLAVSSIIFYAWGEPRFVVLMLISVVVNYRFGIAIGSRPDGPTRKRLLATAITINLLLLGAFKYTNFIVENTNYLAGYFGKSIPNISPIALPIGISFYTFHAISYLIDIHRRNAQPNANLVQYALYIMFFPQLVAGPIIRYKDIYTQLPRRTVTLDDFNSGALRFTMGLAKKILIANPLGLVADFGFDSPAAGLSMPDAWLYLLCYTLQIYFDFSGYSDMAIGLARLFGFRFPENFNYPYSARSIQEFWRRWHISLSTWFKDYVYIPLGGNRCGELRTMRNLWIVFLLTGLWHGASWNFVIWGAIHGFFLTMERQSQLLALDKIKFPGFIKQIYTVLVVMLAWVFFRANSLEHAIDFLHALSGRWPNAFAGTLLAPGLILLAIVLALGFYPKLVNSTRPVLGLVRSLELEGWLKAGFIAPVLVLCLMFLAIGQYNPFIYFRF